jgi:hypothetical protein
VRVEFQFERPVTYLRDNDFKWKDRFGSPYLKSTLRSRDYSVGSPPDTNAAYHLLSKTEDFNFAQGASSASRSTVVSSLSLPGITAPGSISEQEFDLVNTFQLDPQRHAIVLRLVGQVQGKTISNSVTTRTRSACVMCGYRSRTNAKFCSQCGASLQLID